MEKPRKMTTRQYVGLVRDLNSRMAQLPPIFQDSQKLDESELVDSIANKAPRSHKAMLISQGFNPKTTDLETFVEHCERAETTDNIAGAKFSAVDKDSEPRKKNRLKSKGEHGKKRQKRSSKLYLSLHGDNTSHTSRECNVLNTKGKEKPKFSKKDYKRKSREVNLLEKQASHQRAKYLKYKKLNKAVSKKKTRVILDELSERDSSSSSEDDNYSDEGEKNCITYDSESGESKNSGNSATDTEEEAWNNGCRELIVINKLNNSTSNIKEHKLSSNNLDRALHDAHILNTLRKPSKMVKQTKSKKKLKHVHFSPIIFFKLVIPEDKKDRQSKTRLAKYIVYSGASESILRQS